MLTVDTLAQEIRRVDGNHSLGAGALAEALMPFLAALAVQTQQGVEVAELAARLRETTEAMAHTARVDMDLWDRHSNACLQAAAALVDVPAVGSEPVALIEREVLAELQKHWSTTGTVCSPLFKSKFGDKVPLFAHPPRSLSNEAEKDGALLKAALAVEQWWLERGMFHFDGAPYAIFALRSALSTRKGSAEGDGAATGTTGGDHVRED